MKVILLLSILPLAWLAGCGCSGEESVPAVPADGAPTTGDTNSGAAPQQNGGSPGSGNSGASGAGSTPANPLAPGAVYREELNTTLPDEPFFKEYAYPGATIINVASTLGAKTAWMTSTDKLEDIEAFYAKKFTDEDGKVAGVSGRYFRLTDDNRRERVSISERTGGGYQIAISR